MTYADHVIAAYNDWMELCRKLGIKYPQWVFDASKER